MLLYTKYGLVPFNPQRVLDMLDIQAKKITPPSSSHGPWVAKTPHSTAGVQNQMQLIKELIDRHCQSPPNQAIGQLAKACESTMQVLMLRQQMEELHAANQHQKGKQEAPRSFIAQEAFQQVLKASSLLRKLKGAARGAKETSTTTMQ
ncbi:hypothetical protein VTN00DRAFT_9969 [Thermoascus crustaceus]|uniref:uncharacterized protein n=1 Tax=Thermoascus crustaceus TaxID=5088 RepID=UPI0037449233